MVVSLRQKRTLQPSNQLPEIATKNPPPIDDDDDENQKDQTESLPYFEESILIAYRTKKYSKCIKMIEKILKVVPKENSKHYKILLAASHTMIGKNFKRSHQILDQILKHNPIDSFACYGKAVAYYFDTKFDESLIFLDRAISADEVNMDRAKKLKIKIQTEMREVKIVVKKIDVKMSTDFDEDIKCFVIEKDDENEMEMNANSEKSIVNEVKTDEVDENELENQTTLKDSANVSSNEELMKSHEKSFDKLKENSLSLEEDKNLSENALKESEKSSIIEEETSKNDETASETINLNESSELKELKRNSPTNEEVSSVKCSESLENECLSDNIESLDTKSIVDDENTEMHKQNSSELNEKSSESNEMTTNSKESSKMTENSLQIDKTVEKLIENSSKIAKNASQNDKHHTKERNSAKIDKNTTKHKEKSTTKPKSNIFNNVFHELSKNLIELDLESGVSFNDDIKSPESRTKTRSMLKNAEKSHNDKNIVSSTAANVSFSFSSTSIDSTSNSLAQKSFTQGLDRYMSGELQQSLDYFSKALEIEPDFDEADELMTKAQELLELLEVGELNMTEKNYSAVVEIMNQALDIDESNDVINRKLYFQRGLAYYHLNNNEKSLKDYEEYNRLSKKIE